ncbi:F0F1 ATP synthase subunit A [Patulibacter sp. NPDC049589]|uniref:F0F1 ATP synthase subunit A n=1 Tax=Patulibacter sp. NPDC049589 TaxID=3154731 RepID=UPI00342798E4
MSTRAKVFSGLGIYVALMVIVVAIFGFSRIDDSPFKPENEFKLDPWIDLGFMSINKAVLYIVLAGVFTIGTMVYIANRMQAKPNRTQTLIELIYEQMKSVAGGNMDQRMATKWFPFIATLFLFIWFSNLIGYIPLPTNSEHTFDVLGVAVPSFALYAATANLSVPLVLAILVFVFYTFEGIRVHGFAGYFKSLVPAGVHGPMAAFIWVLELMSNFMRLISLSVRLFANILAGHLIILFMSGGLAVLLGLEVVGIIALPAGILLYLFEIGLVATLQAFIFATLTAIYIGGAVSESH